MGKVYDWFEERLEIQSIADDITSKYVPPHVNIFYCLGGITFTCFIIQAATGFAMTFYYRPTVAEAFASVEYLMYEVNYGWLFRSMHRWSASMMVLMMILHIFRVYLTGGFKKPRELTWVTGVTLAVVTVSFGVRNFQNLEKGIGEIFRVLKKNGTLVVLEFSKPKLPLVKQFYNLYMNVVTPGMGGLFSKNRNAYQYLNESVQKFPEGKAFTSVLENAGFQKTNIKTLSFGICTIYTGEK
jgi:hypothetical protein